MTLNRNYLTLPRIPDAGLLDRYLDTMAVIVPLARTNLDTNPSGETNTTGYSGTAGGETIARSTTQQARGAYSVAITPTAGTGSGVQKTTTTVAGQMYAASVDIWGAPGVPYLFRVVDGGGTVLSSYSFIGTGKWIRPSAVVTALSVSTLRQVIKNGSTSTATFYTDGWQMELCNDGYNVATTYIDGDQRGLMPNQSPAVYGWNGMPHASTSYRTGQTRAGGRIVKLRDANYLLTAISGLGLPPPEHQSLRFAQLDGAQYQNTLKPPRTFSLAGRIAAVTPTDADAALAQIGRLLDRDLTGQRQPLVLTTQAQECGEPIAERVSIRSAYSGNLEGTIWELPTQQVPISFEQFTPAITGLDQGATIAPRTELVNMNAIAVRAPNGLWGPLGTGVTGGGAVVYAMAQGLNGLIYIGGDFTDAGGTGTDYLAAYNPQSGAWTSLGSATAINGIVRALAVGPDGRIYAGGAFTNAGGVAAGDGIAVWDPVAGTWAALSTGTAGQIFALAFSPAGILYAGGLFTSIGGSTADNIAQWSGAAWSNLASDTALNGPCQALAWGNGRLYVGGNFTNVNGIADADYIASWSGTAWAALSTGMNSDVLALAVGQNGLVYAGGIFTTAGGLAISYLAVWNGQQWAGLGTGVNNTVRSLAVSAEGIVYAGGVFSTAGGLALPDGIARWTGATWLPMDINFAGTATVYALLLTPGGALYAGYDTNLIATAAGITTVTNSGSAEAFPTLVLYGPSTGAAATIYQLINTTTGYAIYFRNLAINVSEQMTLTLDPKNITFRSTFQGNIISTIAPGSLSTAMMLQPGANTISLFIPSDVTAVMYWPLTYNGLNDALYKAVPL